MKNGTELIRLRGITVHPTGGAEPDAGDGGDREPGRPILREVSLDVRVGRCLGIMGRSGSGKSSILRAMTGELRPDEGRVEWSLGGRWVDPARCPAVERRGGRRLIRTVHQEVDALNELRCAADIVADPIRIHAPAGAWWDRLTGKWERACRAQATDALGRVGLAARADALTRQLSGGQKQRVAVARTLALKDRPAAILLDEPTSSLDPLSQAEVLNVLSDLRGEPGLALVLVSHDLHIIRYLCDEVIVVHDGAVVDRGPTTAVFDPKRVGAPVATRELLEATDLA